MNQVCQIDVQLSWTAPCLLYCGENFSSGHKRLTFGREFAILQCYDPWPHTVAIWRCVHVFRLFGGIHNWFLNGVRSFSQAAFLNSSCSCRKNTLWLHQRYVNSILSQYVWFFPNRVLFDMNARESVAGSLFDKNLPSQYRQGKWRICSPYLPPWSFVHSDITDTPMVLPARKNLLGHLEGQVEPSFAN